MKVAVHAFVALTGSLVQALSAGDESAWMLYGVLQGGHTSDAEGLMRNPTTLTLNLVLLFFT